MNTSTHVLLPLLIMASALLSGPGEAAVRAERFYDLRYRAQFLPQAGTIRVELRLQGERLPSEIRFTHDPQRHRSFASSDAIETTSQSVTWRPRGKFSRLSYDFVVAHPHNPGHYDSLMTQDWAVFRGDRLVPPARVTAPRNLKSRATLEFVLPEGWTAITPYERVPGEQRAIDDPTRRFDQPQGWMIAGKLGTRSETIAGIHTIIVSPAGEKVRRQDTLAFLNWNLPQLANVFKSFPSRLLIVSAGDPMWRGGLSAPASLFIHSDRPLISENRTSTLLHELVHVAMGIRGDAESDWIVEGFAEFYSIETLRRSGGIGEARHHEALQKLAAWAARAPSLFVRVSSGAVTARAVLILRRTDAEIRQLTGGKANLDDVARELARRRGDVSLALLQSVAASVAGRPLKSLQRTALNRST